MSDIDGFLLLLETIYKAIPNSKGDCDQLEPLQIPRNVEAASVIRSEMMDLAHGNCHCETSCRAKEVVADAINRMSVFTIPASASIASYDSFLISLLVAAYRQSIVTQDVRICEWGGSGTAWISVRTNCRTLIH